MVALHVTERAADRAQVLARAAGIGQAENLPPGARPLFAQKIGRISAHARIPGGENARILSDPLPEAHVLAPQLPQLGLGSALALGVATLAGGLPARFSVGRLGEQRPTVQVARDHAEMPHR